MKIDANIFWERFDSLMKKKFSALGDFCKDARLNYNTIISQRQRKSVPKIDQLVDMANALATSIDYLVNGKEQVDTLSKYFKNNPEMLELAHRITLCKNEQLQCLNTLLDTWGIDKGPGEYPKQGKILA